MVDRKELEALIVKAQAAGATVTVDRDATEGDHPIRVRVIGLKGVGSFPMSPLSFAERMRKVV